MNLEEYRAVFMVASLASVLIVAAPTLSMVVPFPRGTERFSELWVLGPNHMAEDYPFDVRVGEQYQVFVGIGILALKGNALKSLKQLHQQGREMDLMRHLLPRLIEDGEPVHAYVTEAFWYDVGSTERYEKLSDDAIEEHLGYLFTP